MTIDENIDYFENLIKLSGSKLRQSQTLRIKV